MTEDHALQARAEQLRAFIREHASGGCRILSGDCDCLLCAVDDLLQGSPPPAPLHATRPLRERLDVLLYRVAAQVRLWREDADRLHGEGNILSALPRRICAENIEYLVNYWRNEPDHSAEALTGIAAGDCDGCKGSGQVDGSVCAGCAGTGRGVAAPQVPSEAPSCPICEGKGWLTPEDAQRAETADRELHGHGYDMGRASLGSASPSQKEEKTDV